MKKNVDFSFLARVKPESFLKSSKEIDFCKVSVDSGRVNAWVIRYPGSEVKPIGWIVVDSYRIRRLDGANGIRFSA